MGCPACSGPTASRRTLATIEQFNVPPTKYGAIDFAKPDGTLLKIGEFPLEENYQPYDFFPPQVMMLGMTYMYHGRKEFGLELVRRCMTTLSARTARPGTSPTSSGATPENAASAPITTRT